MVDVLGHHPSIVLWCAHNEPLAIDVAPGEADDRAPRKMRLGGSMLLPTWNKNVLDRSITRALHRADPSRAVDPHSGVLPGLGGPGTDTHFYFGWYHGKLDGLASCAARGAAPRPLRHRVRRPGRPRVRRLHGARAVARARLGPPVRARTRAEGDLRPGTCRPPSFATFDAWRAATQAYQAALVQLQVEDLRRLKYAPTGGFCHFCFADGHPAVTWSVLDHERGRKPATPRSATRAGRCSPMLEPRAGLVHVVSEQRRAAAGALIEVTSAARGRLGRFAGDVAAERSTYVAGRHVDSTCVDGGLERRRTPGSGAGRDRYERRPVARLGPAGEARS